MKEEGPDGKNALTVVVRNSLERVGRSHAVPRRCVSPLFPTRIVRESAEEDFCVPGAVDIVVFEGISIVMTSSKDALRIDEFQALEAEYNHIVHHEPESSLSSAIADLLQELPEEVPTQETIKSVSKPVVALFL